MRIKKFVSQLNIVDDIKRLIQDLNKIFGQFNIFISDLFLDINDLENKTKAIDGYFVGMEAKGEKIKVPTSIDVSKINKLELVFYLDEANNKLKVAVKKSNGEIKTGVINLA